MTPLKSFGNVRAVLFASVLSAVFALTPIESFALQQSTEKVTPKKQVTITSDSMEALSNQNIVIFRGNVVAVEDFTLCSDELFIHYDENKDIKNIEAGGNVRIFQDSKQSTSEKAVYDRKERKIILTGKAQVKQCTDTIKGDKITVFLDKDNALVEGGQGGRVKAVIMPEKKCPEGTPPQEKVISEETRCKGAR